MPAAKQATKRAYLAIVVALGRHNKVARSSLRKDAVTGEAIVSVGAAARREARRELQRLGWPLANRQTVSA